MPVYEPLIIEIKPSKMLVGEIGCFAARSLEPDFVIATAVKLEETLFLWSEFEEIDAITRTKLLQYCLTTDIGFFAPKDLNWLTVPWNMNHSCSYNVGFDDEGNFVSSRHIQQGEELNWDYGMGMSEAKFKFQCKCGSGNCRNVITGNDWKNDKFREKNEKYFLRELLDKAKDL